MGTQFSRILAFATLITLAVHLTAQPPAAPKHEDTEVYEPVPPIVTPGATPYAPPSDAIVLFDGTNLDQWVAVKDKSPAKWIVADGIATVNKATGSIETKRSFKNYQLHIEWRIPDQHHRHRSGARQQRRLPRLHRPRRRRIRTAGPRLLQQQDLRQRSGRQHLQAGHPAGKPGPQARRVADLRRRLDSAHLQRRRLAQDARLRHRLLQRRARAKSLPVAGRDPLHRQALLQKIRHRPDQATGARRQKRTHQLPQHLG